MIELMLAVVVLTVGLVLILQSLSSGMRALTRAQNRFLAGLIASERLEQLEEEEIKKDGLKEQSIPPEEIIRQNKSFDVSTRIRRQTIDIQKFPQDFLPGEEPFYYPDDVEIQKVDVCVRWQQRAKSKRLTLSTYLDVKQE